MTEVPRKKRRSRTNWFFLLGNFAVIFTLIFSYFAAHVPPSKYGYLSLLGLAYPFILFANLGFIVFWFFKRKRFMVLSSIAILSGWTHLTDFVQISMKEEPTEGAETLKVTTYNVRLFGLYNWENNKEVRDSMFAKLDREEADILCFQEFFHSDKKGYFTTRDSLIKFLPTKYYHERYTHAVNGRNYFGVALFSKYRIVNKGFIPFESDVNNFCIFADILYNGDTVRVYNAHLQSIRFSPKDYAFVDENRNQEDLEEGSKRIAYRLKLAMQKREVQVNKVVASIEECPYPVILCGDFNDTPVSYTYESFSDVLEDSFIEAGSGIGNTYIGVFPSFRIDYIFHSEHFKCIDYVTQPEEYSDHHGVTVILERKKES